MRIFLHEKNLSAQSDQEIPDPWLFIAHGHQGRPKTDQPEARKGPETIGGLKNFAYYGILSGMRHPLAATTFR